MFAAQKLNLTDLSGEDDAQDDNEETQIDDQEDEDQNTELETQEEQMLEVAPNQQTFSHEDQNNEYFEQQQQQQVIHIQALPQQ